MRADKGAGEKDRALRAAGATVVPISGPRGTPDRLVGYGGQDFLLEYKSARALRADGSLGLRDKITLEGQQEFRAKWRGAPIPVVSTVDEALRAVGIERG